MFVYLSNLISPEFLRVAQFVGVLVTCGNFFWAWCINSKINKLKNDHRMGAGIDDFIAATGKARDEWKALLNPRKFDCQAALISICELVPHLNILNEIGSDQIKGHCKPLLKLIDSKKSGDLEKNDLQKCNRHLVSLNVCLITEKKERKVRLYEH
ncbi:hypothetical protein WJU23_11400 [Prosthecobacter sp. SYSU 5D2]|uniref:hypothetical protein n=1 Tax=Prosthecobacter sp. SYSU 5D2 TaxID=3134134 RepID=UPI0031FE87DC